VRVETGSSAGVVSSAESSLQQEYCELFKEVSIEIHGKADNSKDISSSEQPEDCYCSLYI